MKTTPLHCGARSITPDVHDRGAKTTSARLRPRARTNGMPACVLPVKQVRRHTELSGHPIWCPICSRHISAPTHWSCAGTFGPRLMWPVSDRHPNRWQWTYCMVRHYFMSLISGWYKILCYLPSSGHVLAINSLRGESLSLLRRRIAGRHAPCTVTGRT